MTTRPFHRLAARILLVTFTTCSVGAGRSFGQPPPPPGTATEAAPPPAMPPPPTLPAVPPQQLTKEELRDLVAPVALYPDVVLASLLPATTNADQLHEAARFVGTAVRVDRIPEDRGWDGSVVALLQFPDVLRWLDANPAWTDEMGQAVTYQQGDVLQAIQDFRRAAKEAGNLQSNQYQKVRAEPDRDIRIEPARPDVVYVPSYDPAVATQPQPVAAGPGINPWIAFGGGVLVGALGAWALYSIFDDDDDHDDHHYGGRRVHCYDNYYYYGRRRPDRVDWQPRARPYRQRSQGWQQTRRLEHASPSAHPATARALRPPQKAPGAQSLRPREQRRETRRQRQLQRRENRQDGQLQRRDQRRERQQLRRDQRQQKQQGRQQRRPDRQQQRRQQEAQRHERRQEQRTQRQEQRKTRRQQNAKKKDGKNKQSRQAAP